WICKKSVSQCAGDHHVTFIFTGTGGRPSPRANSVRLDAGIFSGTNPKYEMAFVITPLMAGSMVAQMNQQTRTSTASATHTAAVASAPTFIRALIIDGPIKFLVG